MVNLQSFSVMLTTIVVILLVTSFASSTIVFRKCCHNKDALNDTFQCTQVQDNILTSIYELHNYTNVSYSQCFQNAAATDDIDGVAVEICRDSLNNISIITVLCKNDSMNLQCGSLLEIIDLWGASMVVLATVLYTIPYAIVIVFYFAIPALRIRAYDKSVVTFNASYIILNCLIIFIGWSELCHRTLPNTVYGILGLIILYMTQATVLWLFIICFDMTSVITRFRWAPASDSKNRSEKKKFRIYSMWVWGVSLIPAIIATIMEFNSFLPQNSPFRPNFSTFHGKHSISVVVYTLLMPVSVLITNTVLFIYTTYKMIKIQRENAILNVVKKAKEKYFVYLKLYLIMDAPWLTGALSAIFPSLWILKFIRMIQPILMLIVIIPRKNMVKAIESVKKIARNYNIDRFRNRINNLRGKELKKEQEQNCMTPNSDNVDA